MPGINAIPKDIPLVARINPSAPNKGYKHAAVPIFFQRPIGEGDDVGWYEVTYDQAVVLSVVKQWESRTAPPLFEILPQGEARSLAAAERMRRLHGTAERPIGAPGQLSFGAEEQGAEVAELRSQVSQLTLQLSAQMESNAELKGMFSQLMARLDPSARVPAASGAVPASAAQSSLGKDLMGNQIGAAEEKSGEAPKPKQDAPAASAPAGTQVGKRSGGGAGASQGPKAQKADEQPPTAGAETSST